VLAYSWSSNPGDHTTHLKHSVLAHSWTGTTCPEWEGMWKRRIPLKSQLLCPDLRLERAYVDRLVAVSARMHVGL